MALQEKYDAALSIIRDHNQAMTPNPGNLDPPVGYIDPDTFLVQLKMAGGSSEDRLKGMSFEDILAVMPTPIARPGMTPIKPTALAKDIARVFRGKEEPAAGTGAMYVSAKKAERMTLAELVDAYDPDEPDNAVGKRLRDISRGEPFLVFPSGNTKDPVASRNLLEELKTGYPPRKSITIQGQIYPLYRVGEKPDDLVDENPIYRGRPLRPDGTCDQTNRSWSGVPVNIRQLVRVVVDLVKVELNIDRANDLIDRAIAPNAEEVLTSRYQDAALKYKELEKAGDLPRLKVALRNRPGSPGALPEGRRVNPRG